MTALVLANVLLAFVPLSLGIASLIRRERPKKVCILALAFVFIGPPLGMPGTYIYNARPYIEKVTAVE